jgi:hypothetical protein
MVRQDVGCTSIKAFLIARTVRKTYYAVDVTEYMAEEFETEKDVYDYLAEHDEGVVVENNGHKAYIYHDEEDEQPQTIVERASGEVIDTVTLAGPEQDLTEYERYVVDREEVPSEDDVIDELQD